MSDERFETICKTVVVLTWLVGVLMLIVLGKDGPAAVLSVGVVGAFFMILAFQ
jgi:hypothetical protein